MRAYFGTPPVRGGPRPRSIADRFWEKVNKDGPVQPHCPELGQCWVWTGHLNHGYGRLQEGGHRGRGIPVTHISWEMQYSPIPEGVLVLHRCDNPPCVRPTHLFLGTGLDNSRDMVAKGRVSRAPGESNPMARYSETTVLAIRDRFAQGGITQRAVAKEFGIDHRYVNDILHRKSWSHLDGAPIPSGLHKGSNHWKATLADEQVAQIRERYKVGGISQTALAHDYGVGQSLIWCIVNGKGRHRIA